MTGRKKAIIIRKTHRYLGIFLGIQFLFWTGSGLYFSWTNLDEIHGDHFKNPEYTPEFHTNLLGIDKLNITKGVQQIALRTIGKQPYYWVNEEQLFNAITGEEKKGITQEEALRIAEAHMKSSLKVKNIQRIISAGPHHEYREKPLPAYVISYFHNDAVKAYVSEADGSFQTVRHRSWRWFDFLWMTHTMDYESRDNFNTLVLRAFSLMGLRTVCSGFVLWSVSSPTLRKILKRRKNTS